MINCDPEIAFVPLHPPLAVQEVALLELHVNVVEPPDVTLVGDAEIVTVGVGVGGGVVPCVVADTEADCTEAYPAAS